MWHIVLNHKNFLIHLMKNIQKVIKEIGPSLFIHGTLVKEKEI